MYSGLRVKCPLFRSNLIELIFSLQIFEKVISIIFHADPTSESRIIPCGQKTRQTYRRTYVTKLTVAFRSFTNAPMNELFSWLQGRETIFLLFCDTTALLAPRPPNCWPFKITDTKHWLGLLWKRDRPDPENCTWRSTTFTGDRHPCSPQDSNRQTQQASGSRPAP